MKGFWNKNCAPKGHVLLCKTQSFVNNMLAMPNPYFLEKKIWCGLRHGKMCHQAYADSEGWDYPLRLIRVFAVCSQSFDTIECIHGEQKNGWYFGYMWNGRPRWLSWMRGPTRRSQVQPRQGWQHSFIEIDQELFFMVILSLPLIQEGQLSVSGERMCTILVNRSED